MLLERSKSKSDGNIGEESIFGPSNGVQFAVMKSRLAGGSIDCDAHQGEVVSRRKKIGRRNEGISVGRKDGKKDQHLRRYALFRQEHRRPPSNFS